MKKTILLALALTFTVFFIGCNKEETTEPMVQENEMIPIAKITAQNDIQHLFLQRDMKEFFLDIQEGELVFMEVIDSNKNGEEAGLLYRIYNREQGVTTTTLMTSVLSLKGNIYYYDPIETRTTTVSCTTKDCDQPSGCAPTMSGSCTTGCRHCTVTKTAPLPDSFIADVIRNAVAVY